MRKTPFYGAALAAASLLAGAAYADTMGTAGVDLNANANAAAGSAPSLTSLDKNSDGKISKSEAAANKDLARQFSKLDTNKDGFLDASEFARFEASGSAGSSGRTGDKSSDSAKPGGY